MFLLTICVWVFPGLEFLPLGFICGNISSTCSFCHVRFVSQFTHQISYRAYLTHDLRMLHLQTVRSCHYIGGFLESFITMKLNLRGTVTVKKVCNLKYLNLDQL